MQYPRIASSTRASFGLIGALCLLLGACSGSSPTATPQPIAGTASPTILPGSAPQPTRAASAASAVAGTVAPTGTSATGTGTATTARGSVTAQAAAAGSPAASAVAGNPHVAHEDFTVDFGDFQSRAQLTYPATGNGPFPTVMLIPGPGPDDLDSTVFDHTGQEESHNFRDIADYLTANGYAVVRYNKHYVTGPTDRQNPAVREKFSSLSQEQLLADANTVYLTTRTNPRVDTKRIILYALSEGTIHATQLVLMHSEIAGLILQGAMTAIANSLPGYKGPVLILQGGEDTLVSPAGAKRIDDALAAANHPDHTLIVYPNLGHSLGQAPSAYTDEFQPIDPKPLGDTAAWLTARFTK